MNFFLWGWSGQLNTGDDVFLHVVASQLRRENANCRLFMEGDRSGYTSRLCGVQTVKARGWSPPLVGRLRRAWLRRQADCFVLAGGTLLPTLKGVNDLLQDRHWFENGRRMVAVGLSVGPFESAAHEEAVGTLLSQMEHVALRDDYSYDWAMARKLPTRIVRAFDLAVLFPQALAPEAVARPVKRTLGVSLLAWRGQSDRTRMPEDLEMARALGAKLAPLAAREDLDVVFLSLCLNPDSDDRLMANAFAEGFGQERLQRFDHDGDPVRTYGRIQELSHLVSMRLHGGILAYTAGVPFVQLEYHPKCQDFARTIGLADRHRCGMKPFDLEQLIQRVSELIETKSVDSRMSVSAAQARASLNFVELSAKTPHAAVSARLGHQPQY